MINAIGQKRLRFQIETLTAEKDDGGGYQETWQNFSECPVIWGEISALSSREILKAQQHIEKVTHIITTRFHAAIKTNMRFKSEDGARIFKIITRRESDMHQKYLEFTVEELIT